MYCCIIHYLNIVLCVHHPKSSLFHHSFFKDVIYLFLERREGREKERERNIHVWLPLLRPLLGTWPATQACALTGNRTADPLVHRLVLSPLSHTSQGPSITIYHPTPSPTSPHHLPSDNYHTIVCVHDLSFLPSSPSLPLSLFPSA